MPIPESQLETWSRQGSIQQSSTTYQTVRAALMGSGASYATDECEIFLQGSYGNATNIYAESDVDIVICLDSIMRSDLNGLPNWQRDAYHQAYQNATYTFADFKSAVVARLRQAFGASAITVGNKAIKITANGSRRSADVVVCYQFRRYIRFVSINDQQYVRGVIFPTTSSGEIVNYPKRHSESCTAKHQETAQWFKPVVRILKNMRSRMMDERMIAADAAPSYYIEGMLWNVPNGKFGGSYADSFRNCLNWILQTDRTKLTCANEQYWLLGNSSVQWQPDRCDAFLNATLKLWNGW